MMNVKTVVVLAGLGVLVTACSSDSMIDIGDGSTSQGLSAYAASWDGYAEAYQFGDGSDRVRITLDSNGDGQVRLGNTELLGSPSPGDPAPAWDAPTETDFAYAITAHLQDERLRFDVDLSQRYQAWCELQTPVPFSPQYPGVYACSRYIGVEIDAGGSCSLIDTHETVDCNSQAACQGWCACTEESCTAAVGGPQADAVEPQADAVLFDGALTAHGKELTGTLSFFKDRIAVRLQRQ
jgi:hypothetical protein